MELNGGGKNTIKHFFKKNNNSKSEEMPGTRQYFLHSYLFTTITSTCHCYFYPHFIENKTEAQQGYITFPRSYR